MDRGDRSPDRRHPAGRRLSGGDTTTIIETASAAAEQIEDAQADVTEPQTLDEIIGDKGYHSNQTMIGPQRPVGLRSCP